MFLHDPFDQLFGSQIDFELICHQLPTSFGS